MRAYELQPKDGFDALTLVDRPEQALGPYDVRVRIHAVSLNFRDLNVARMAKKRSRPIVPVSDGAGEVIEVGEHVTRRKIGDRVAGNFFPTWIDGELDESHH